MGRGMGPGMGSRSPQVLRTCSSPLRFRRRLRKRPGRPRPTCCYTTSLPLSKQRHACAPPCWAHHGRGKCPHGGRLVRQFPLSGLPRRERSGPNGGRLVWPWQPKGLSNQLLRHTPTPWTTRRSSKPRSVTGWLRAQARPAIPPILTVRSNVVRLGRRSSIGRFVLFGHGRVGQRPGPGAT